MCKTPTQREEQNAIRPLQFRQYENHGLPDTGVIQSAMLEELRRIRAVHPATVLQVYPAPDFEVQIANGSIVPVRKQILLRFFFGGKLFEEKFMILPTMGNILIGMSFSKQDSVTLDFANSFVKFPDITLQLKPEQRRYKSNMIKLRTSQKTVIKPYQQLFNPVLAEKDLGTIKGTVETFPAFERKTQLLVSPALAPVNEMSSHVQIITQPKIYNQCLTNK